MRVPSRYMPTQRFKLLVAYRGTRYHGWQRQAVPSISRASGRKKAVASRPFRKRSLAALGAVVGHPVIITGSSRTDGGVHAKGQIAHFDSRSPQIPTEGLRRATNHKLPDDILIRDIEPVPDTFDAITCAVAKRYQYFVWNAWTETSSGMTSAGTAGRRWTPPP